MRTLQHSLVRVAAMLAILCSIVVAGPVKAAVVAHTGADGQGCTGGVGAVEVILTNCVVEPTGSASLNKAFQQNVLHRFAVSEIEAGIVVFQETITNQTGTAWTDFHFEFEGVRALTLTDFSLRGRSTEQVEGNMLWLFFDEPVMFGSAFTLSISLEVTGAAYTAFQQPSVSPVPLPAALPLFLAALAGLGFFGWRRRAAV